MKDQDHKSHRMATLAAACLTLLALGRVSAARASEDDGRARQARPDQVLEWNQVLLETLVATGTPNAASPRAAAIVHAAIFDAYNGIEDRYTPVLVRSRPPRGASRRAAVVAAAHAALTGLFPSQQAALDARYAATMAALPDEGEENDRARERGIGWGREVARAVLAWRASDGFGGSYPPFTGGNAPGQWRPTPTAFGPMAAQPLAHTSPFVVRSATQFRPEPPRGLGSATYADDLAAVKALGRKTGSTRSEDQTALAAFWEGNASIHWNQAASQLARASHLSISENNRLLAVLNIAMADTASTIWSAKLLYGATANDVTWRPVTAIPLADADGNPATAPDPEWSPLMNTPSHPEYPAGHPSLNGAAATVLLARFQGRPQAFTLTTAGLPPRTYTSIAQARADGNDARVWGGMHYPSSVRASDAVGEAIARYVERNAMLRRGDR